MSRMGAAATWMGAQRPARGGGGASGGAGSTCGGTGGTSGGTGGTSGGGGGAAAACPWEDGDNDSPSGANSLCSGNQIYGTIDQASDQDWYTWTVPPNRTYTIGLSEPGGYQMVLYKLVSGSLQLIANADDYGGYHEISRTTS